MPWLALPFKAKITIALCLVPCAWLSQAPRARLPRLAVPCPWEASPGYARALPGARHGGETCLLDYVRIFGEKELVKGCLIR